MRIQSVEAWAIRLPRDLDAATGRAGTPTKLSGEGDYRWSSVYPCLYSVHFETTLVRVTTSDGLIGWGEAQAPLAPEVTVAIIERLLKPVVEGCEFDGAPDEIHKLWDRMYSTMRVRGQTGGFMIDAISAIDIALWDLAGKAAGKPVAAMLAAIPKTSIPAYLSGLPPEGGSGGEFDTVKVFYDTPTANEFWRRLDRVQAKKIAVDALWRHTPESALKFGHQLDARGALWFEAPLPPEDEVEHAELAHALATPIAIGESYRTRWEMAPFFRARAVGVFQPDLGRCGLTEGMRMAEAAAEDGIPVVPHLSIAFGPQIAAALHFAAAAPGCNLAEYNPQVLATANRFLRQPIEMDGPAYRVPQGPGLGIEVEMP